MANSKQATKRARQADKRQLNNKWQLSRAMTAVKGLIKLIEAGNATEATAAYPGTVSLLDKLAGKNMIHKNKAARHKSRLNARLKALVLGKKAA